jgi:hypothetical protein
MTDVRAYHIDSCNDYPECGHGLCNSTVVPYKQHREALDALAYKLRESERIAAERNVVIGTLGQRVAELERKNEELLGALVIALTPPTEEEVADAVSEALRGAGSRS